jgi:hypothetical protein
MTDSPTQPRQEIQADDDGALQMLAAQVRRYFYPKDGSLIAP